MFQSNLNKGENMKKKILTIALTLVMCLTIMLGVSGCKEGASATLTATNSGTLSVAMFVVDNMQSGKTSYDMQVERIKYLNALGTIKYDADGDGKIEADDGDKEWSGETPYAAFANDGGSAFGFDITKKTTGSTLTLRYLDASLQIQYKVS